MIEQFYVITIWDLLDDDEIGEDGVKSVLSTFSCRANPQIQSFTRNKAIDFAKRKLSITYLVMDESGDFVGVFALSQK